MHKIYTNCTEKYYQEFEESKSGAESDPSQKYCDLFSHLINDCGDIWTYCHDPAEVMDMKEMQIMSFYNYYDAFYVDTCDIVQQYINKPFSRQEKCSEEEQISAQNLFLKCSHKISSNVYEIIPNMTREEIIIKSLCKAMEEIEESCSKHLTQCLSNKDSSHILRPHLENIRHFFNSFLQDMIPDARFTGCKNIDFKISRESTTSDLARSKDKKNDQIFSRTTVEAESENIEQAKSEKLLNYLDTVYNTHLETFDMNQDTKHDIDQSFKATREETNTPEPHISKTETLKIPAEIEDSDNFKQDKKDVLSPDVLDADADQSEMSEVNQKTNKPIKSSDSITTKSEILSVLKLVVDNISKEEGKSIIEGQELQQLDPNNSKEENLNIIANKNGLKGTDNSDLLKETPRADDKQARNSSTQNLQKNKEDNKNLSDNSNGDAMVKGFEKDLNFTKDSKVDDKGDLSTNQKQENPEERNGTENQNQAEVLETDELEIEQKPGEGEAGKGKPSDVEEGNQNENPAESDGQYGWTNWDTADKKIVIPANNQDSNGNAAVPYMNILIQEDEPSNEKLVLPTPKDLKENEDRANIPTTGGNSSSSAKLFINMLIGLLAPAIHFLINVF